MIVYDPARAWREIKDGGFNEQLGPVWYAQVDAETSHIALMPDQRHINYGGVCHGGVYMALCDVAMGVTAFRVGGRRPNATIDFRGHFLAAAKKGDWIVAEARVNRAVSGLTFMEAELWSGGRKCFISSGIWKALTVRPVTEGPV